MSFDRPKHIEKSVIDMSRQIRKVGIDMDKDLFKQVKHYCAENDLSMKDLIQISIKEYLQKYRK
jgi:hypothetical protein